MVNIYLVNLSNISGMQTPSVSHAAPDTIYDEHVYYKFIECLRESDNEKRACDSFMACLGESDTECRSCLANYNEW